MTNPNQKVMPPADDDQQQQKECIFTGLLITNLGSELQQRIMTEPVGDD